LPSRKKEGHRSVAKDICLECGRSVAPGSGLFVNRIPDANDLATRRSMGWPYPEGDFLCAECDAACPFDKD
jgi:hypothetical protein